MNVSVSMPAGRKLTIDLDPSSAKASDVKEALIAADKDVASKLAAGGVKEFDKFCADLLEKSRSAGEDGKKVITFSFRDIAGLEAPVVDKRPPVDKSVTETLSESLKGMAGQRSAEFKAGLEVLADQENPLGLVMMDDKKPVEMTDGSTREFNDLEMAIRNWWFKNDPGLALALLSRMQALVTSIEKDGRVAKSTLTGEESLLMARGLVENRESFRAVMKELHAKMGTEPSATELVYPQRERKLSKEKEIGKLVGTALGSQQKASVLDVGCGDGTMVRDIKASLEEGGKEIQAFGTEVADYLQSSESDGVEIKTYNPDKQAFPFAAGTMDVVTTNMVLHHASDPQKLIADIHAALKPGGTFIMRETDADSLATNLFQQVMDHMFYKVLKPMDDVPLEMTFKPIDLWKQALEQAGFEDVKISELPVDKGSFFKPMVLQARTKAD